MPTGSITKWIDDRGFGFIDNDDEPRSRAHFVHVSAMRGAPAVGDRFRFDIIEGQDGRTKAANLRSLDAEMAEADRVFGAPPGVGKKPALHSQRTGRPPSRTRPHFKQRG